MVYYGLNLNIQNILLPSFYLEGKDTALRLGAARKTVQTNSDR
jgi:hypothetical protein